jgi:hypothetical protein
VAQSAVGYRVQYTPVIVNPPTVHQNSSQRVLRTEYISYYLLVGTDWYFPARYILESNDCMQHIQYIYILYTKGTEATYFHGWLRFQTRSLIRSNGGTYLFVDPQKDAS